MEECGEDLPQFLVMENVPLIHCKSNIKDFGEWIHFLDGLGYKSKWEDLNALNFGIPQNRNRCFMVSWLASERSYMFPQNDIPVRLLSDFLEKDAIKYKLSDSYLKCHMLNSQHQKEAGNGFEFKPITDPKHEIVGAITTKCGARMTDPFIQEKGYIRMLTEIECFQLMGVTKECAERMVAVNSRSQCVKQAGNSIVVDVLMAIFRNLFDENVPGQMTVFDYL